MSRRSLFYIGAAVLLFLTPFVSMMSELYIETGRLSLEHLKFYMERLTGVSWVTIILWLGAGVLLLVKAFLPDLISDVILGGFFAIFALYLGIMVIVAVINNIDTMITHKMWRFMCESEFEAILHILLSAFLSLLNCLSIAALAAIILLKSNFGQLFFVPAGIKLVEAVLGLFAHLIGLFGFMQIGIGALIVLLLLDGITVMGLLLAGLAVNED